MESMQAQLPTTVLIGPDMMPAHFPHLTEGLAEDLPESHEGRRVTEAEFWATWYTEPDYSYEWNNGILEVKPVGDYHGFLVSQWFIFLLNEFLRAHPIARAVGMDIGFRLAFSEHVSIRKPDYAVIRNDNPAAIHLNDASYAGLYDLCIEFLSYSSPAASRRDTVQKKWEYAGAGVQEYFILDARGLETAFYRLDRHQCYQVIQPEGGVIRSAVLPGFQFRRRDLYDRPDLKSLIADPAYRDFILLDYQAQMRQTAQERQRAEAEAQKAKTEAERAAAANRRAEAEAQKAKTEAERAAAANQRAETEAQRAGRAEAELNQLKALLAQKGIMPPG